MDAVRECTLATGAFETRLAQDHLFVADLLVFQSRLLARAPRSDQAVLAGGLVAVEAAFLEVAQLERDFWEMAFSASGTGANR